MTRLAAKALSRIGIAMLILCIACRFAIRTEAGKVGDDLACMASAALILAAFLYLRFGRLDDRDRARAKTTVASTPPADAAAHNSNHNKKDHFRAR